jgi:hypothetical protein
VPDNADPDRQQMIRRLEKKWMNGTVLKYHFMRRTSEISRSVPRGV